MMSDPPATDVPTWLAVAAALATTVGALIAAAAARSARRQADIAESALRETKAQSALTKAELQEVRRQNEIALHAHRLDTYNAFLELEYEVNAHAAQFDRKALWAFSKQARLAEFYFPEIVAAPMSKAVDKAVRLHTQAGRARQPETYTSDELEKIRNERDRLYLELADDLHELDKDIRRVLRLVADA